MIRIWDVGTALSGLAMGAGGSIASTSAEWGPAAPAVRIEVTEAGVQTPTLVLVYGASIDPYRSDRQGSGQIASCQTMAGVCAASPAGTAFRLGGVQGHRLQVRWLDDDGESEVAGVAWKGSGVPRQVDLRCNLAVNDPHTACSIVRVHG
ncbi:hypothetical protein [Sphingomonas xinjiangensis]|uniref:Uncharacterized protein n=1 Tax=Sphingomonas xinjiangensis TaxID=643568 RepID=A0A840Y6W5_9SPHN|nr:hypothetical protein [Sphingomonas xinjiangensis]MBB5709027.1 hypothetical protein [Sphingomonas xinjiangensis]